MIAFQRALEAQLLQIGIRSLAFRNGKLRNDQFSQFELQIAALGNLQRCLQPFRMIGETFLHFCRWLEPCFTGSDFRWSDGGK